MKLRVGDILIPPKHVSDIRDWWKEGGKYVVKSDARGVLYVIASDGDIYDEERLYINGYIKEENRNCFKLVRKHKLTENE